MRHAALLPSVLFSFAALAVAGASAQDQEKPLPKNEVRIQVPGCAYNRTFITEDAPAGEPVGSIKAGRRLKMSASKETLENIKKQGLSMIELTGRIRRADLEDLRGISVGGGVRVGGGAPQAATAPVGQSPGYYQVMIDVESFRLIPGSCPKR